jgi:RNA polymerase sigma-70 factor (ECF subfamily)
MKTNIHIKGGINIITDILKVFEQNKNFVFRLALSYTKSVQDAEDISQIVFIKMFENKDKVEEGKEKAWLAKVTVNQCKNLLKSFWRKNIVSMEQEIEFENPEHSEIYDKVMKLQAKYRVVILLYYFEEYSTKEIADILNIGQSLVTTRLHRARKKLETILKEECYEYALQRNHGTNKNA